MNNNTRATIVAALSGFQYVSINSQKSQAYICACKYIRICVRVCVNLFLYVCVCLCVCMYVYTYVCMYVHAHMVATESELEAPLCHCLAPWGMAVYSAKS